MLLLVCSDLLSAKGVEPDGMATLAMAREAAGGETWASAETLLLSGHAVFYGEDGHQPYAKADDYHMWRAFDEGRSSAHEAEGKVRISAISNGRPMFLVGFDGSTTWTEKGVMPKAEADAYWASNFGFSIIRQANKPGFAAQRIPDDQVAGHQSWMVELTDPKGSKTLFGVDKKTKFIRMVGFITPKGWHYRIYDDFVWIKNPGWLQARHVTLYYNGRKANEVFWKETKVNVTVDPALFTPPTTDPR